MEPFAQSADKITKLGTLYGSQQLIAGETLANARFEAGQAMRWPEHVDLFEGHLDAVSDLFFGTNPSAGNLFCAEARLQFYGILASNEQRIKWTAERDEAWHEVANAREAA